MDEKWQCFDGSPDYPLSAELPLNEKHVVVYRSWDKSYEACPVDILDQDGWHRGRNEYFDYYLVISLP